MIHLYRREINRCSDNSQYIKIGAGINSLGFRHVISGSHNRVDRSCISRGALSEKLHPRVILGITSSSTECAHPRLDDTFVPFRVEIRRLAEGNRDSFINMFNSDTMFDIDMKDCTIGHYHELFTGAHRVKQIRWRNCIFVSILRRCYCRPARA